ncbi:conserved membrane hypothetical protein [Bosea sp. 62]|uniref:DUF599 domain-containing protein n=1 Tax=unclassified Bosea (in: a-proteobacteria) TaxID=2653178 RepID=UPI001258EE01|nr:MULTISPECIES: DUF599 family protein [unclassified Bosea (in: a-proteobacteria)]CAD5264676.1 conserved membrane hypothetical protein [Bosea sp. 46]CAD5267040.1 conserved membrane hypothetical protein [Bosea sp. 21B]CAD5272220.1 conserved membrane hypothetical protein [Bosea sp. 7B]VVT55976.1 Uncharacterized membrane protein [Bosea sp. EC-HK365B]VXB83343.1 conserved membrane hypothetical protein [Bosea sp. 29B]
MAGFGPLDLIAIAFFAAAWIGYLLAVEIGPHSRRSLNALMNERRERWIMESVKRENRIIDTQVMNGLQNGTAFFASTSLIAIGGSLTLLQSADRVVQIFADLPFATTTTRAAWEIKVIGLAVIFAYAFFKFGWAYRLFNYCAILIGAIPPHTEADKPETIAAAREAVAMNIAAGLHFNRGQRAFFFALAYLGWFISPWLFLIATAAVLTVMWRRQFASDSAAAVGAARRAA